MTETDKLIEHLNKSLGDFSLVAEATEKYDSFRKCMNRVVSLIKTSDGTVYSDWLYSEFTKEKVYNWADRTLYASRRDALDGDLVAAEFIGIATDVLHSLTSFTS